MNAPLEITLISCAVLGFRHGFDYDHIAAISDITSVQEKPSTAMRLGLLYALGHHRRRCQGSVRYEKRAAPIGGKYYGPFGE